MVIITLSPNPERPSCTVKTFVIISAMTSRMPTTSTGSFSVANKATATSSKTSVMAIGDIWTE
jgi:hypothetical protein